MFPAASIWFSNPPKMNAFFNIPSSNHICHCDFPFLHTTQDSQVLSWEKPGLFKSIEETLTWLEPSFKRRYCTDVLQNQLPGQKITIPLFDLTNKDFVFKLNLNCYKTLIFKKLYCFSLASFFVKLNFTKTFILDVDWSIRRVGAILLQKDGRNEQVIVYASKDLSPI
jgi:hypothetical protein